MEHTINDIALYAALKRAGIAYEYHEHIAVFTVAESKLIEDILSEGQTIKNLFLKDRKGSFWLVCVCDDLKIDLKLLSKTLGAKGGLSFANTDYLEQYLKVTAGSVCPFAILNTQPDTVKLYFDEELYTAQYFHAHPMRNDRTITTQTTAVVDWLEQSGYPVGRIDFHTIPPLIKSAP